MTCQPTCHPHCRHIPPQILTQIRLCCVLPLLLDWLDGTIFSSVFLSSLFFAVLINSSCWSFVPSRHSFFSLLILNFFITCLLMGFHLPLRHQLGLQMDLRSLCFSCWCSSVKPAPHQRHSSVCVVPRNQSLAVTAASLLCFISCHFESLS